MLRQLNSVWPLVGTIPYRTGRRKTAGCPAAPTERPGSRIYLFSSSLFCSPSFSPSQPLSLSPSLRLLSNLPPPPGSPLIYSPTLVFTHTYLGQAEPQEIRHQSAANEISNCNDRSYNIASAFSLQWLDTVHQIMAESRLRKSLI